MPPPLGFIPESERTNAQHEAHARAEASMVRFALAAPEAGPVKVMLTDRWKDPRVVADVGFVFPRFVQLTGSCVGAGGGQALFTLITVQRCLSEGATKAFIPFWAFNYGRCRALEGDRGQGEGAMGSSFAAAVSKEGVITASEPGLPAIKNFGDDGLILTDVSLDRAFSRAGQRLEFAWSDGNSSLVTQWLDEAIVHPVGSAAKLSSTQEIKAAIINGYPVTFACSKYIGDARVQGTGDSACVIGRWDTRGGHQQSIHNYWDHPQFGPLYWAQNNWPKESYPRDPAGGPVCGCWVKEADVADALRYQSEIYAFSHLNWFPAQPEVLNWVP